MADADVLRCRFESQFSVPVGRCVRARKRKHTHCAVSGSSTEICKDVYQGASPLSEPEASALANTVRRLRDNLDMYLTIHSFGQQILVPYGYATGARPPNYENMVGAGGGAEARIHTHVCADACGIAWCGSDDESEWCDVHGRRLG